MKQILILITALVLTRCQPATKAPSDTVPSTESRYKTLLSRFREKSFDTLFVYSPENLTGEYEGVELDSAAAILFPDEIAKHHFLDPPGLYAVYRFPVDKQRVALIARTPSEYVPSSIKLFFFDRAKDSITNYIELAQNWGDAGSSQTVDAWLFRDGQKKLKTLVWTQESYDHSAEDEKDTTIENWESCVLLDLSTQPIDTISTDTEALKSTFSRLMKQKKN